ncbi:VCBS repeat-containing protein [Ferruginibacter paludis]|uniref:VCBS repeat-containing protein n=1 Tax=Ferruginibacter paludis TaxID=1310417 RepID=UPI0025B2E524|nr:VCBS repeat-containing protein [Ferruginibacter paludis]MDN3657728.1 VCBS repeat-containing protein [Ferruginibacter paludis]
MPANRIIYLYFSSVFFLFISCKKSNTLFTSLSSSETNVRFQNTLKDQKAFGILYYLYYYNGGGVSVGDVNNDGLPDIYFTANNHAGNKLYINKGNFKFEDITENAGVAGSSDWCTGSTMADVNGDGLLDIYVSAVNINGKIKGHNGLFINNGPSKTAPGEVTFTESAAQYGLNFSGFTTQVAFFDYDHDGDLDCYILNQSHKANENIVDTINRRKFDAEAGDKLMRNDMNTSAKKFTDVSAMSGIYQSSLGYGLGISVADINNDGWEDIYIGNDFHENDYYYINNGNGTFTESGAKHFRHYSRFSMGNDIADFNNDGQLDIVTVDMLPGEEKTLKTYGSDENADTYKFKLISNGFQYQYSKNCLQQNNGDGISFSEVGLLSGISATDWSWAPLFADFDNDGNKDLFISGGIVKRPVDLDYIRFVSDLSFRQAMNKTDQYDAAALEKMPDGASHPFLFQGAGNSHFSDVSDSWGTGEMKGYFNGSAYADLDNDGNLDIIINSLNAPAVILKNNAPKKNYITVSFKGDSLNSSGIGAKAYVFAGKKIQYQQLMLTRGFESSVEPRLHFGLGDAAIIDSLLIVWPNQQYQLLKNVTAVNSLLVQQKDANKHFDYVTFFPLPKPILQDITSQVKCNWKHRENNFIDFNSQYLIPHMQSTRGPKIAVGDINKDGLDDFFACGANGQPGSLMVQTKEGTFVQSDTSLFNKSTYCDEVDAVFFDANKDGFPDLYVVSGGDEYADGNAALADKLYINDGEGHFTLSTTQLPVLLTNKSCVVVADVDHDGDDDLFIGGLANAKEFGQPQSSFLLLNDGKGNFKPAAENIISLKETGMVTAAVFTDIDMDGWMDLVVAGEWMPVKMFINNKGIYKETDLPASTGLWQSLYAADVNGDGLMDILAGNWGHNSKLYAGKDGPLKLYVKDFDKNGSPEQVMTYTIKGKEYTFLAKDELERALPVLKKAYLTYNEVAGKTVQYMFFDLFKDYRELKAETLTTTCFINDGKGGFKNVPLPESAQFAPVFSFAALANNQFLAAGNFYGVVPYEGRYDALQPTIFSFNKNQNNFSKEGLLPEIDGEVRDAKWIRGAGGQKILVMAKNNSGLVFLQPAGQ